MMVQKANAAGQLPTIKQSAKPKLVPTTKSSENRETNKRVTIEDILKSKGVEYNSYRVDMADGKLTIRVSSSGNERVFIFDAEYDPEGKIIRVNGVGTIDTSGWQKQS